MVDDEDDAEDDSGYAKEMSDEYKEKQRQLISSCSYSPVCCSKILKDFTQLELINEHLSICH